ncbi:alpha/beta fold hydrolase [Streptomyces lycii]|uniref:Alpha/beta fold hydrolase n=1 Tax=Streptomyces lycii TaxID=2654337 RepID=A0ABQ7FKX1_9ACTN|nr:alpha/beta fold hydrolase [Streptomyces lycii]
MSATSRSASASGPVSSSTSTSTAVSASVSASRTPSPSPSSSLSPSPSSSASSPLLLVHGFWHGSWCWSEVVVHAAAAGRAAVAVDMAGHGLRARRPRWFTRHPYDPEAVVTEVSPVADIGLDDAAELLTSQIERIGGGRPLTVVAHSAAGPVLTRVAQRTPELVAHAVYLAAYMPASEVPVMAYSRTPEAEGDRVAPLLRGKASRTGALRLDFATNDAVYRQGLREAFYGDVDPVLAEAAMGLLTPDSPVGIMLGSTTLTRDGWGSVPRTFVVCANDMALQPALQRRFIAEADAAFPDNPTSVVTLDASHSPFLSMPGEVARVLTSPS